MRRPNILFVSLPSLPFKYVVESFTKKTVFSQTEAMPMGLLYVSSYLKAHNELGEVKLLDYPSYLEQDVQVYPDLESLVLGEAEKRIDFYPDIVGISLIFSTSHRFFQLTIKVLKALWPKATLIVGGVHASNCVDLLLSYQEVDYVLRGEGELAFSEVVKQYANDQPLKLTGLYSVKNFNPLEPLTLVEPVKDIDQLPFPDLELLDVQRYLTQPGRRRGLDKSSDKQAATIFTTRGCPFKCTYCSAHTVHGRKVRYRAIESVIEEMKTLYEKYGVTLFIIEDDLFTANKSRVLSLLSSMKKLNVPDIELQFPSGLNVATLDEDILDAMIATGTEIVNIAIESGSEYVQTKLINKRVDLVKAKELVRICRKKGLVTRCYFVLGFPGETKALMEETVQYMKELECDWAVIMIATPLVGSAMYRQFVERGDIKENDIEMWSESFFQGRQFDTQEISAAELNDFTYRVNLEVNFLNNVNLRLGNFDLAISIFNDIIHAYPFHIFAWYGLYLAYQGKNDQAKAKEIYNKIQELVATEDRSKDMYQKYGYLIPDFTLIA
ncbi:MAG: radical SAM protein [Deltaproteobacteria bacterium]|nr:radical SAM protein [Deltaproteobacteria bacterium]